MTSPYEILGLKNGATEEEAKAAFRKLAKTCHPDLHPNDPLAEAKFKEINEAYDKICKGETEENIFSGGFKSGGFDPFGDNDDIRNIFAAMHRKQTDVHLQVRMTLEECFYGKELNITIPTGTDKRIVKADMPRGIMHGNRLTVPQGGNQPNIKIAPGDLHITVNEIPHNRFTRDGVNLTTIVPVTVFDVMLGKSIEVVNIENRTLKINIPAGFDSSRKLRLSGQGMPILNRESRGDLLVELFVQYPVLTDEQIVLIKQADDISSCTV